MMLAVAVFTIALYVGLSYRRSGDYRRQAQFYAHAREVALVRARNVESGAARLDGFTAEENRGWDQGYNFGSREAAAARWKAAYAAGVNLIATDQFEDLAASINLKKIK